MLATAVAVPAPTVAIVDPRCFRYGEVSAHFYHYFGAPRGMPEGVTLGIFLTGLSGPIAGSAYRPGYRLDDGPLVVLPALERQVAPLGKLEPGKHPLHLYTFATAKDHSVRKLWTESFCLDIDAAGVLTPSTF